MWYVYEYNDGLVIGAFSREADAIAFRGPTDTIIQLFNQPSRPIGLRYDQANNTLEPAFKTDTDKLAYRITDMRETFANTILAQDHAEWANLTDAQKTNIVNWRDAWKAYVVNINATKPAGIVEFWCVPVDACGVVMFEKDAGNRVRIYNIDDSETLIKWPSDDKEMLSFSSGGTTYTPDYVNPGQLYVIINDSTLPDAGYGIATLLTP